MYQTIPKTFDNREFVRRISDGACIPFDPANTDYAEYLKWLDAGNTPLLAEGNEPLPADEVLK